MIKILVELILLEKREAYAYLEYIADLTLENILGSIDYYGKGEDEVEEVEEETQNIGSSRFSEDDEISF